jgi:adenylosuccinate synthase
MINGVTQVIMTKADVLDEFEQLNLCTSYLVNGKESKEVPYQMNKVKIEPVLHAFEGWKQDTTPIRAEKDLPAVMQQYVQFINQRIGAPVKYISNGPGRDQIVSLA